MSNFNITFTYPWLLLLLIPAAALVLFAYFRISKKYRRNRNRVLSTVLGMIMATCGVLLVSGITVNYDEKNRDNEMIVVVDASYSNAERQAEKDQYIRTLLNSAGDVAKVGVVTFGGDVVYAAELTNDPEEAYENYQSAVTPDRSSTNIAAALTFAHGKLSNPKAGKLLLVSDGIETDGDALTQAAKIAMEGVIVDVVEFSNGNYGKEIQLLQINLPQETIVVGQSVQIELIVQSSATADAAITMYDNGEAVSVVNATLTKGTQSVFFTHAFEGTGLHQLSFTAKSANDTVSENNTIYSYVYLDVFDKILILERGQESSSLKDIAAEAGYKVDVRNISEAPASLDELREYDQIILNNVANADMPEGFDEILNEYVYEIGGGLLTVGGVRMENGKEVANVYNREDMKGTLYQEMLPVEAEDYTPPVAVMLIIDTSGSMGADVGGGKTQMDEAKESALASLDALDDRDYLGIIKFDNTYEYLLAPTPLSQREKISQTIKNIRFNSLGGTVLTGAIEQAGRVLSAFDGVNKKHIVVVTDGETSGLDSCISSAKRYYDNYGVTTSIIDYRIDNIKMDMLAAAGNGKHYVADDGEELANAMREDLSNPEIREYELKTFQPTYGEYSSIFSGVKEEDIPTLDGFFGTKIKKDAKSLLIGEYGEPIYAQWTYGKGKVGSFMCDLSGHWSKDFLADGNGKRLVTGVIGALFPSENIQNTGIDVAISAKNSIASVSINTAVKQGELVQVEIRSPETDEQGQNISNIYEFKNFSGYETLEYKFTTAGIYEIEVTKLNSDGEVVARDVTYRKFSYSQEYNPFLNDNDNSSFLLSLAKSGNGKIASSVEQVFEDFVQSFYRTYDPRVLLASAILIALLLEVAVRKFKFKWPHEIVREKRTARKGSRP